MEAALLFITTAIKLAPIIISAGGDITALAQQIYTVSKSGTDPTPEQWASLVSIESELRVKLHAPLPPETA